MGHRLLGHIHDVEVESDWDPTATYRKAWAFVFAIIIEIDEREKPNINIAHFVIQAEAFPKSYK